MKITKKTTQDLIVRTCLAVIVLLGFIRTITGQVFIGPPLVDFTITVFLFLQLIISFTKDASDINKKIFELSKIFSTFWFDILKWLIIVAAMTLAEKKYSIEYLKYILYFSYIIIYLYIYSLVFHMVGLIKEKIDENPAICKSQKTKTEILAYIASGLLGILLMKLFLMIPDLVEKLSANKI